MKGDRQMTSRTVEAQGDLFRLSLDLFAVLDLEGTVIELNPAWERTFGFTIDEIKSQRLRYWMHPDDREKTLAMLARLANGHEAVDVEVRFRCRDGSFRWTRWNATSDLTNKRIIADGRDFTDQKGVELELELARNQAVQSFEDRTQFLISMSQEVRTPVSTIVGMAGMLLDSDLSNQQRKQAGAILDAAEDLLDFFNEILDYARLERGELEIEATEADLSECVREVLDLVEPEARRRGLSMRAPDWGERSPVRCDPWRLQQVLANLLRVAVELAQEGGVSVTCALGRPDEGRISLDLDIHDTGAGLHEEWVEQLFTPFAQRDLLGQDGASKSALGLTITRQLLELMGGKVTVTSDDSGNTLSVVIPFELVPSAYLAGEVPDAPTEPLQLIARAPGNRHSIRILVVEDNPVNQRLAVRMLEDAGYSCDIAANGIEAIAAVRARPFDLILMDARMPEMDGYAAATRIRHEERPGRRIPIVAMTADAMPGVRQRCLEAGMDDYLTKPIHPDELVDMIQAYVKTERADDSSTPGSVGSEPIDVALLREVTDDDSAFQRELASLFLSDVQRHLSVIAEEARQGDLEAVCQRAHSIKGAASHVGAHQLSSLAAKLESVSRAGDATASSVLVERVRSEFDQTKSFLEKYFRGTAQS